MYLQDIRFVSNNRPSQRPDHPTPSTDGRFRDHSIAHTVLTCLTLGDPENCQLWNEGMGVVNVSRAYSAADEKVQ